MCMRENPFYIDTIRNFRDRRNEFKKRVKIAKVELDLQTKLENPTKMQEARVN